MYAVREIGGGKVDPRPGWPASRSFLCHVTSPRGHPVDASDFPRNSTGYGHCDLFKDAGGRPGFSFIAHVYCILVLTISFEPQARKLQLN